VREEWWHPLVRSALCRRLELRDEYLHSEVQTRDGSIIDLVYLHTEIVGFEVKMADGGASLGLDERARRQLRHFSQACDALYLVTVAAPRAFELLPDGRLVSLEPAEAQLLPEGVGWLVFDRLSHDLVVMRPPRRGGAVAGDREHLVDMVVSRLERARRMAQRARQRIP